MDKRHLRWFLDTNSERFKNSDGRCMHQSVLAGGTKVGVFWVPTRSGPRYSVIVGVNRLDMDSGYTYGTYEEAAAVFSRVILEDDEETETD